MKLSVLAAAMIPLVIAAAYPQRVPADQPANLAAPDILAIIGDDAFAVMRIVPADINIALWSRTMRDIAARHAPDEQQLAIQHQRIEAIVERAQAMQNAFGEAAARDVYVVLSPGMGYVLFVPLRDGMDTIAVRRMLRQWYALLPENVMSLMTPEQASVREMHGAVVAGPRRVLQALSRRDLPAAPPLIARAMSQQPDAPVQFALVPGPFTRLYGDDDDPGTRMLLRLRWVTLTLREDADAVSLLTLGCDDAEVAEQIHEWMNVQLAALDVNDPIQQAVKTLKLNVEEDRVIGTLAGDAIAQIRAGALGHLHREHLEKREQSRQNVADLAAEILAYAKENDGHLPERLYDLYVVQAELFSRLSPEPDFPLLWTSRPPRNQYRWLQKHSSYVTVPHPGLELNEVDRAATIIAFEKEHASDGLTIAVAFADGRVEVLPIEEARERIRQDTGKTLAKWSED